LLFLLAAAAASALFAPGCAPAEAPASVGSDEADVTGTAVADKAKLFAGELYYVRIKGWDPARMSPASLVDEQSVAGAELSIHVTDKASGAHCPDADVVDAKLVYRTKKFSVRTSGNFTNGTPKSSYKLSLEAKDDRLFGMKALNLKSMWNDASQMREALAWRLMNAAGVHAPKHTYAKMCIDGKYFGLYSLIEQVDKPFLEDHFGGNKHGNLYKAYWPERDIGPATLEHRSKDGDDSGKQYFVESDVDARTYQLKTNDGSDDPAELQTYDDLATFVRTINGVGVAGLPPPSDSARFDSPAFAAAVEKIFDVKSFLRWAGVSSLVGAWDNYLRTPANYYVYDAGPKDAPKEFMRRPYFVWIPWDYDNSFGASHDGTRWHDASIVDWERAAKERGGRSALPLVTNLLRNTKFLRYYLDHIEWANDTFFNDAWVLGQIGDGREGLRSRVLPAAFLESDTPSGRPHTGRQFTNDEVWRHGFDQHELNRGTMHLEGILHFVRMRHDSVKAQLAALRSKHPKGSSGATFPARAEEVP